MTLILDAAAVPSAVVRVSGDGQLAAAIREALTAAAPAPVDIVALDDDDPSALRAAERDSRTNGRAFLPVRMELGQVTVGPYVTKATPGCLECLHNRERMARAAGAPGPYAVWTALREGTATLSGTRCTAAVREMVAGLVAAEVAAVSAGAEPRTRLAVLEVATAEAAVRRHTFLPDPYCSTCGSLPDDSPEAGTWTPLPRRKRDRSAYRLGDITSRHDDLVDRFVDPRCGVIGSVAVVDDGPVVMTSARLGPLHGHEVNGYGRTLDQRSSVTVAIAEALERMGGLRPRDRAVAVYGSFAEFGPELALDPLTVGLPRLGRPSHCHVDYHPDLAMPWVYGYSFARGGSILVPASLAYYGGHLDTFAYECSNGCALGTDLEDAILHGIFEVVERDAFLITWYARLALPRVNPWTSTDATTLVALHTLEEQTGSRLHVFDATMPEGIPALVMALVDEDDRPNQPKVYCGAAAHLDPERALRSGLLEIAAGSRALAETLRTDRDRLEDMLADSNRVIRMDDHSELYALPEAWPRLEFLYQRAGMQTMADSFGDRYRPADDLTLDLLTVVGRLRDNGLDVVVVDQTGPEHRAAGVTCVKVLVPGTLPMTFGHRSRRAEGMLRLLTMPVRLGLRDTPLSDLDLNPYPHPFP